MKTTLLLLGCLILAVGLLAQNVSLSIDPSVFTTQTLGSWQYLTGKNSTTLELKYGKLHVTHSTHEPCFAATIPGCSGHDKTWRDVYSASNGVVVLERTINQVLVTRTNVTTTQTYEWPE